MKTFAEFGLSLPVLQAVTEMGFVTPSPIQVQALPVLLAGPTDFMGLAGTGTGKTAAFGIPLVERIAMTEAGPATPGIQALILCPTRELALQVAGQIELIGRHKKIRTLAVYGGAGFGDQMHGLRKGAQIVVGTPGRVIDHLRRGSLSLDSLETLVLDEADEMISMGFKEELETILAAAPADTCRKWMFSATMSPEVRKVADAYLRKPAQVQVNRTEMLSANVEQIYYVTQEANKPEVLCKLIDAAEDFYGLVFFQTKALLVDVGKYLAGRGYAVDGLHGDMDQLARERTMRAFRERKVTILLCTDVASRGLDVKDVTHVVNYSLPRELDHYVHRIGRTARSGKSGMAMSLVTHSHRGLVGRIERMTKTRMKEGRIPTRKDIGAKKVSKILGDFQSQATHARAAELLGDDWKTALAAMPPHEIAGRFLSLMYPEIFAEREQIDAVRAPVTKPVAEPARPRENRHERREWKKPWGGDRRKEGRDQGGGWQPRPRFKKFGPGHAARPDRPKAGHVN